MKKISLLLVSVILLLSACGPKCVIEGCNEKVDQNGLCSKHYEEEKQRLEEESIRLVEENAKLDKMYEDILEQIEVFGVRPTEGGRETWGDNEAEGATLIGFGTYEIKRGKRKGNKRTLEWIWLADGNDTMTFISKYVLGTIGYNEDRFADNDKFSDEIFNDDEKKLIKNGKTRLPNKEDIVKYLNFGKIHDPLPYTYIDEFGTEVHSAKAGYIFDTARAKALNRQDIDKWYPYALGDNFTKLTTKEELYPYLTESEIEDSINWDDNWWKDKFKSVNERLKSYYVRSDGQISTKLWEGEGLGWRPIIEIPKRK